MMRLLDCKDWPASAQVIKGIECDSHCKSRGRRESRESKVTSGGSGLKMRVPEVRDTD